MRTDRFDDWFTLQLKRRGWTPAEFHRRSGVSRSTVHAWTAGLRTPDPDSCDLIADVLGIDLDTVLAMAGHRPPTEPLRPDDPRAELIGLLTRVRLDDERVWLLRQQLQGMIEYDRRQKEKQG